MSRAALATGMARKLNIASGLSALLLAALMPMAAAYSGSDRPTACDAGVGLPVVDLLDNYTVVSLDKYRSGLIIRDEARGLLDEARG